MTQFFLSALWALCWFISLLHFKIFKFNSKESPLCHTFWSAKYKLTCQRWHFQTRQYIHPFSTQNFLAFGVTFFAPKFDTNLATIPWTNKKIYFRILKHAAQRKGIYSFKFNNANTRIWCETYSMLCSFEQISHIILAFPLLILDR